MDVERMIRVKSQRGLEISRHFTEVGVCPFDLIEWEQRNAQITAEDGRIVFEQKDVEVPKSWSQLATNVTVSKYFRGKLGTPERETSVREIIERVARTLTDWGRDGGYFHSAEDSVAFQEELEHLLVRQMAAFNSPVWFNLGVEPKPQCSACFIQSVKDEMSSIMDLAKSEVMLFKYGSGTGSNLSTLRSAREYLSGGGLASGPVSFMKGYDAFAGAIKSGGKTRRAAKMVILNAHHPDIVPFITSKAEEEKKAWALIEAGYDAGFNVPGGAYDSIDFQNANHSVRVADEFMERAINDGEWWTRFVRNNEPAERHRARELLRLIADSTWICGDPGMQFHTTINAWHTCPETAPINASNPCSEYMFLDDSACNLASLNLMKFRHEDGSFNVEGFEQAVDIMILAQEIIVGNAAYPTEAIERNSHDYRPLGLGYANLGALLMAQGVPYDSDQGRAIAAAITALMTGRAYRQSALIAEALGPFAGFERNLYPMFRVMAKHAEAVKAIDCSLLQSDLHERAVVAWLEVLKLGEAYGYRNAQATVIAPTGTIAFMMDCDTTGIEPDIGLVKYKKLVGGGLMKIVNQTVPEALRRLGYNERELDEVVTFIDENGRIEGAPDLKPEHLPVFDCSFKAPGGSRSIQHLGHVRMMAAVQPFVSGAISKTVNLPTAATVEEITETFIQGWKLGLKAIAIYRDGCKATQPLSTSPEDGKDSAVKPVRRRLSDERRAITHKFTVASHEGYLTVGLYEDGRPGEIFITMSKTGSTISGLMDSFATAISIALQYGVPLWALIRKFAHSRFEPSGFTGNAKIPVAKSIMDYIFRWLALKFPDERREVDGEAHQTFDELEEEFGVPNSHQAMTHSPVREAQVRSDAPACPECGHLMVGNGRCWRCHECGTTSGVCE